MTRLDDSDRPDPAGGRLHGETNFVMDSAAFFAYLRGHPGGAVVQKVLQQCRDCETRVIVPASHLAEVYAVAARESPWALDGLAALVDQLPIEVCPVTARTAETAAQLVSSHPGLTVGQAVALALSRQDGATLLTADQEMAKHGDCLYVGPEEENPV